jgi:hypothetical protein
VADTQQNPSAIVYGVIPPRFGSPPLRAVAERLPYLAGLGVDAIWLSPIAACPPGDFGYASCSTSSPTTPRTCTRSSPTASTTTGTTAMPTGGPRTTSTGRTCPT